MITKTIGRISIIVILTSCVANAQTPRKLIVPDEYKSIKAAMGNASSGDTVFLLRVDLLTFLGMLPRILLHKKIFNYTKC